MLSPGIFCDNGRDAISKAIPLVQNIIHPVSVVLKDRLLFLCSLVHVLCLEKFHKRSDSLESRLSIRVRVLIGMD